MIIRSQEKKIIVNLDNLDTVSVDSSNAINVYNGTTETRSTIAIYSTEEKAIKVLDMICNAYERFRGGNVYEHSIFNMPSDEEVEV